MLQGIADTDRGLKQNLENAPILKKLNYKSRFYFKLGIMIFPFCRKIRLKNQFSYGTNGLVTCFEQLGVEALKNALIRGCAV